MSKYFVKTFFLGLSAMIWLFGMSVAHAETAQEMPSGLYTLDPRHTSVIFKINHLGFSHFTGRFDKVEGNYDFQADTPEQSVLDVTIYPYSVDTNDQELDDALRSENWFSALKYPKATFHAIHIERVSENTAKITGDFTLLGETHTLVLDATLVGAGKEPFLGTEVMGFNAVGTFKRSNYGMNNLEPFIGDEVTLEIDSEFDKDD
jgi:polyisoprenoid-binding protein YceI